VSLLRVPHLVLAVNKMDLVDYSEDVFNQVHQEFTDFAAKLAIPDLEVIPISALKGDNVVTRSSEMPWYDGPTMMHHLETVHHQSDRNLVDVRFPVQHVIRPQQSSHPDYRGYAGQVSGGVMKPGDEVVALPSGFKTTITSIDTADGPVDEAYPPMSTAVRLADDLDISRGDMLARPNNQPAVTQDVEAMVCWMDEAKTLTPGSRLLLKHTTRTVKTKVQDLHYQLDVNTLHRDDTRHELALNEIGRVRFRTQSPLCLDLYGRNRMTGGFVLIDEATLRTVAAGMVVGTE
jgi:bifunctional enzyme CysN/CysC